MENTAKHQCSKCHEPKDTSEFSPSARHRSGLFPWCKTCKAAYQTKFRDAIPKEVLAEQNAAWRAKRDSDRDARARFLADSTAYSLHVRYGITRHEVVELAAFQKEVCAICGNPPDVTKKRGGLHVDHDHATGKVRGLLCEPCNQGLGFFRDNIDNLAAAARYLQSPPMGNVVFTQPVRHAPYRAGGTRNREPQADIELVCKQCGGTFLRKAADEFASRSKGKEGPFCSTHCAGTWGQAQQKVVGLIHGTTNGYSYYKCRCDECRSAHARDAKERRLKRQEPT